MPLALDIPKKDELEISLFGPSYGECIGIHAGKGVWFVVDSCVSPKSKRSRILDYFKEIGVDPSQSVKLIIATHWDDDHVRGLSEILSASSSAKFIISAAISSEEFLQITKLLGKSDLGFDGGVKEINQCFEILVQRKIKPLLASEQSTLWQDTLPDGLLVSLAPSSAQIINSHLNTGKLLDRIKTGKIRVVEADRNDRSIVLWLKVGNVVSLLGSDLLETSDTNTGWSAILFSEIKRDKSSVFKVSHHGSHTGHNDSIWNELLETKPVAILAPWRKGFKSLPTQEDIKRIVSFTSEVYVTAIPQNTKTERNDQVNAMIQSTAKQIRKVDESLGHIRMRRSISNARDDWKIALFHGAKKINGNMHKAFPSRTKQ